MEKKLFILILLFSFSKISIAQVPFFEKMWDKNLGGSASEGLKCFQETRDGGFILGGWTDSPISFDVTDSSRGGGDDYWFIKTDSIGNRIWDKRFGGGGNFYGENIQSLQQTHLNKFVVEEPPFQNLFTVDDNIRTLQIEKIKKLKAERDNANVQSLLKTLEQSAKDGSNLMPPIFFLL